MTIRSQPTVHVGNGVVKVYAGHLAAPATFMEAEAGQMLLTHTALLQACQDVLPWAQAAIDAGCDDRATAAHARENHRVVVMLRKVIAAAESGKEVAL